MPQINNINKRFGRLIITNFTQIINDCKKSYYTATCDCGNIINFPQYNLSKKKSCGCMNRAAKFDDPLFSFNSIYKRWIMHNNISRKKEIKIDLNRFIELSTGFCYYCNQPPSNPTRIAGYLISGIDRLDNNLGYIEGNIVSCCTPCNLMKQKFSEEFFISQVEKIYNNKSSK